MNFVSACAQLSEKPREVALSATSSCTRCWVVLPPVGSKSPTPLEFTLYGKAGTKFLQEYNAGDLVFIHGAKLRHDLDTRTHSINGGIVTKVTEAFPIFNTVILGGRCIKDIDKTDARAFKTTDSGLMICNQSLSVNTGKKASDIFNFFAINSVDDRMKKAELLVNFTRKGTGLTIHGRIQTDTWKDKTTGQPKSATKIQMLDMTLGPKTNAVDAPREIEPQADIPVGTTPTTLWGGKTVESDLPELPSPMDAHMPF